MFCSSRLLRTIIPLKQITLRITTGGQSKSQYHISPRRFSSSSSSRVDTINKEKNNSLHKNNIFTINGKNFHAWWLRDNCLCSACRHPSSFQKIFDISENQKMPKISNAYIEKESLIVEWDEEPKHKSRFPFSWLKEDLTSNDLENQEKTYWRSEYWEKNKFNWHDIQSAIEGENNWENDLIRYGFALFKNVDETRLDQYLTGIGPIHYTEYGRFAHIKSVSGANDISETGYALTAHTDYSTYMLVPPLLQCMYLKEHDSKGGESILVDGFKVSQDFKIEHPEYYKTLTQIPIEFQQFYHNWQYHFIRKRPVIELDSQGELNGIYFGHSHCYNWGLPIDQIEPFYKAYCEFFRYLKSDRYKIKFRLNAGECVAVQNARVLHGREAFDPNTGNRHLIGGYVSWEFFEARRNFRKHEKIFEESNK